jgi:hypothetical protein
VNTNELRESEIDKARELFERSCKDVVAALNGYADTLWNKFDYDEVIYFNNLTNACWQSFMKGYTQY